MSDPDLLAILCRLTRCTHDGPHQPLDRKWDEVAERQMEHAANTYDPETSRSQPLRKGRR